jgi:ribonuclease D
VLFRSGVSPCWKISGSRDLSSKEAAVLNQLCSFREEQARQKDCPTFKIMNNDTLLQLAIEQPQSLESLAGIRGVPQWLIKSAGERLIEIIRRGQNGQPVPRPASQPRPTEDYLSRLEALRTWRKQTGEKMGVPSDVIIPRDVMEDIARANPPQMEDLKTIMNKLPWRFKNFGADIFTLIHN